MADQLWYPVIGKQPLALSTFQRGASGVPFPSRTRRQPDPLGHGKHGRTCGRRDLPLQGTSFGSPPTGLSELSEAGKARQARQATTACDPASTVMRACRLSRGDSSAKQPATHCDTFAALYVWIWTVDVHCTSGRLNYPRHTEAAIRKSLASTAYRPRRARKPTQPVWERDVHYMPGEYGDAGIIDHIPSIQFCPQCFVPFFPLEPPLLWSTEVPVRTGQTAGGRNNMRRRVQICRLALLYLLRRMIHDSILRRQIRVPRSICVLLTPYGVG